MSINAALRDHLLGEPAIVALVSTRVFALRLPQKVTYPAVVLTRVSAIRYGNLRGPASLARPRYQVDSWAQTADGAQALGALCRQRLEGFVGTWPTDDSPVVDIRVSIIFDSEMDMFEEDVSGGLCRHSADYFVFHGTNGGAL